MKPLRCRFKPQQLVVWLKQPICVDRIRARKNGRPGETVPGPGRIILDQLENIYGQKFADRWKFVEYAEKYHLELDLTSPPAGK